MLKVGQEEVEDKEKELILNAMGSLAPLEEEIAAEGKEENEGGNERHKAENDYGFEPLVDGFGQRGERGRFDGQLGHIGNHSDAEEGEEKTPGSGCTQQREDAETKVAGSAYVGAAEATHSTTGKSRASRGGAGAAVQRWRCLFLELA